MIKTLFLGFSFFTVSVLAAPLLVSQEEMNASNNASPPFTAKAVSVKDAPMIELKTPKLSTPVSSPTVIELKFEPTPPSSVKPDSFKVLYGSFEIDITKRILNLAKVTETGVFVPEANLPKGKHKLLMVVEDTAGRKGNRSIDFEVK
jgi:hypothetical protein